MFLPSDGYDLSIVATYDPSAPSMRDFIARIDGFSAASKLNVQLVIVVDLFSSSGLDLESGFVELCIHVNQCSVGQDMAMLQGISLAKGRVIVTIDPDMIDNIPDIYRLLAKISHDGAKLVFASRVKRLDTGLLRRICSRMYNGMLRLWLHDCPLDVNTPMTAFTLEVRDYLLSGCAKGAAYKISTFFHFREYFHEIKIVVRGKAGGRSNYTLVSLLKLFVKRVYGIYRMRCESFDG